MDQQQFEHIENYLSRRLSEAEKNEIESKIADDPGFKEQVDSVRLTLNAAHGHGLKEELESIHKELYPEQKESSSNQVWIYVTGIAASLILIAIFWVLFQDKSYSSDELFSNYFKPFPDYVTSRSSNSDSVSKAFLSYSKGEFKKAVRYFEHVEAKNEDIRFYLGVSYLGTEEISQAVVTFSDLLQQSNKYREQLHWYLSLAYVKNQEREKAIQTLKQIKAGEYQFEEARELLELLSNQKENENGRTPSEEITPGSSTNRE